MMRLLSGVDFKRYSSRVYFVSSGDQLSETKALELEAKVGGGNVCGFTSPAFGGERKSDHARHQ